MKCNLRRWINPSPDSPPHRSQQDNIRLEALESHIKFYNLYHLLLMYSQSMSVHYLFVHLMTFDMNNSNYKLGFDRNVFLSIFVSHTVAHFLYPPYVTIINV